MKLQRCTILSSILILASLAACPWCYFAGRRAALSRETLMDEQQRRLEIALHAYKLGTKSNWGKVHSVNQGQVFTLVKEYRTRFGQPSDTNGFYRTFVEAASVAGAFEKGLVPVVLGPR